MRVSEHVVPTGTGTATTPVESVDGSAGTDPRAAGRPRVAYVAKSYPRFSETFIVREILARETAGEEIVGIASLRPPRDGNFHALISQVRAPVTWIPETGRSLERAWTALADVRARLRARGRDVPDEALRALVDEESDVAMQGMLLAQWALDRQADHLHSHFASVSGRTTRLAHLITGLPWTATAHAKDIFHEENDPARLRGVLETASTVVAVSDMTAAHIRAVAPRARVERIYNGLELSLPWSAPSARPNGDTPRRVLSVGRMVAKKGLPDLVAAVAALRAQGRNVELLLAGDGPVRPALEQQVQALGMTEEIRFLGPLPQHEVMDLLRTGDVFAAPCVVAGDGDRDGLPTVLLEAMAVGVPVVSTPVAGIPEAVQDGVTGLLVGEHDVPALAAAVARVLDDRELAQRLSRAGRARIEDRFDVLDQGRRLRDLTSRLAPVGVAAGQAR